MTIEQAREAITDHLKKHTISTASSTHSLGRHSNLQGAIRRQFDGLKTFSPAIQDNLDTLVTEAKKSDHGKSFYENPEGWEQWKKALATHVYDLLMDKGQLRPAIKDGLNPAIKTLLENPRKTQETTIALLSAYMFACLTQSYVTLSALDNKLDETLDAKSSDESQKDFRSFTQVLTEMRAKGSKEIDNLFQELLSQQQSIAAETQGSHTTPAPQAKASKGKATVEHYSKGSSGFWQRADEQLGKDATYGKEDKPRRSMGPKF